MNTVILKGGRHSHEHFRFQDVPTRILVQTKDGGMYGTRDKVAIYQDTGKRSDGCRIFSFVRSRFGVLDGLVETEM